MSDNQELVMDYWLRPEFTAAIGSIPIIQRDAANKPIAKVNFKFYKIVEGQLVYAIIPEDLSMPGLWHPCEEGDFNGIKARSMIESH